MRKIAVTGLALLLALAGATACGDDAPLVADPPQTTEVPTGTAAGGDAGEVTVDVGETIVLSSGTDRVEITIDGLRGPEAGPVWFDVTVDVRMVVTAGSYVASAYNFVLIGGDGDEYPSMDNTFDDVVVNVAEGDTLEESMTFSVPEESLFDTATIAVYGIGDETDVVVAHVRLG